MNYHPEIPKSGFVTTAWVRKRYSISNSTLYSWLSSNFLPPTYRVGPRAVRFRAEDIQAFEAKLLARDQEGR